MVLGQESHTLYAKLEKSVPLDLLGRIAFMV